MVTAVTIDAPTPRTPKHMTFTPWNNTGGLGMGTGIAVWHDGWGKDVKLRTILPPR
jgi:hypothetical protein